MRPARRRSVAAVVALWLLNPAPAVACSWLLWGQTETWRSIRIVNLVLGPRRDAPHIRREFKTHQECALAWANYTTAELEAHKEPHIGPPRWTSYACVPGAFKPAVIHPANTWE